MVDWFIKCILHLSITTNIKPWWNFVIIFGNMLNFQHITGLFLWEYKWNLTPHILSLALGGVMWSALHPASLWRGGWWGHGTGLDTLEEHISCPCQELNRRLSIHPAWYLVITLIIVLLPGHKADLSLSSSLDVKTVWNCTSTSHMSSWYDV